MFTGRLLDAMSGAKNVVECAFVENNTAHPSIQFFSSPVRISIYQHHIIIVIYTYFIPFHSLFYFSIISSQLRLGPNGVEEILPMPSMSAYEQDAFNKMIPDLEAQAKKGFNFVK
jgi:hypothetical protein